LIGREDPNRAPLEPTDSPGVTEPLLIGVPEPLDHGQIPSDPESADNLRAQRQADEEFVAWMRKEGANPNSRSWRMLQTALFEYGYPILKAWLMRGMIYHHAARLGILGLSRVPENLQLREDDAHELAVAMLVDALPQIRRQLLAGGWEPEKGASLKTFSIGRMVMTLPDAHAKWRKHGSPSGGDHEPLDPFDDRWCERTAADPADMSLAGILVAEIFRGDRDGRIMFELQELGFSLAEIADQLDTTEAAVRSRMSRVRTRARRGGRR
jgi:DNA-directed RNA polymerase specialized sigma24 family protein